MKPKPKKPRAKKMLQRVKTGSAELFGTGRFGSVKVVRIENTLADRAITFVDDKQQKITVPPRETMTDLENFNPKLLLHPKEISGSTISTFHVEGDNEFCSYAVVDRVGIISALGTNPDDYKIYDKAFTYLSWAKIQAGQRIVLRAIIDEDNIVWVVGDLEDNI